MGGDNSECGGLLAESHDYTGTHGLGRRRIESGF